MIDKQTQEEFDRLWIEIGRLRERIGELEEHANSTSMPNVNHSYPTVQASASVGSDHVVFPENFFEETRLVDDIMSSSSIMPVAREIDD